MSTRQHLPSLDTVATMAIIITAAWVAVNATRGPTKTSASARVLAAPIFRGEPPALRAVGLVMGDVGAPISIVEFSDLECPYCRRFHSELLQFKRSFDVPVSITYIHFPLPGHRFAIPAAQASECAAKLGRFEAFVTVVFERQDSLGLKSWWSYAKDSGVKDSSAFIRCVADGAPVARIDSGLALGHRWGVRGTPTVLINGWQLSEPPHDSIDQVVRRILSAKEPFAHPRSRLDAQGR